MQLEKFLLKNSGCIVVIVVLCWEDWVFSECLVIGLQFIVFVVVVVMKVFRGDIEIVVEKEVVVFIIVVEEVVELVNVLFIEEVYEKFRSQFIR